MDKLQLFLCALAASCMLACSSDDEIFDSSVTPTEKSPKYLPITIEVDEEPLYDPSAQQSTKRRAPITFLNTLKSFKLNYMYKGKALDDEDNEIEKIFHDDSDWEANHNNGKWQVLGGDKGWPSGAANTTDNPTGGKIPVTWYAFANNDSKLIYGEGGNPYVTFTDEEASTAQKDFLVSKKTDTWNKCEGIMYFCFSHACSALRFNMKKATNVSDKEIYISEVSLHNVKNSGRFYMEDFQWSNLGGDGTYTLYSTSNSSMRLTDSYQTIYAGTLDTDSENDYLFMIPQTLTAWDPTKETQSGTSGAYLEIVLTIGGNPYTGYVPFSGTFVKGQKHEVKINLGKNSLFDGNGNKIINE